MNDLTQGKKRAIGSLLVWVPVLLVFLFLFFSGSGPDGFKAERVRVLFSAVLFALGFASYFMMLFITRVKSEEHENIVDERDTVIQLRAGNISFVLLMLYVFLLSISIYVAYDAAGSVPLGWMWFMAYSSIFMGYIQHALVTLFVGSKGELNG